MTSGQDSGGLWALAQNPFFTAGFGLAALGAAATYSRRALVGAAQLLRRRMLVEVEITRNDAAYDPFLRWMSAHVRSPPAPSSLLDRLALRLTRIHHQSMQTTTEKLPSGLLQQKFTLVPGPGTHLVYYKSAIMRIVRERVERGALDSGGRPFETVKLTTLYRDRHIFPALFQEAHAMAQGESEGYTQIFTGNRSLEWEPFGHPKRKRPLSSVILAPGVKERIVSDVKEFIDARGWYLDRGIPYRRGYLLHGPPGTGKSSFIQALAGELDCNIAMLILSQRGLVDDRLAAFLQKVPPRTIVLLEDADAAFSNRRQIDPDGYSGANVTFSGLLNALDGVASAEERIVFMTTNHIDRLDEALIRPGRVDVTVRLDYATEAQFQDLWDRFYDGEHGLRLQFLENARQSGVIGNVSTAALQGLFVVNKDNPQGAVEQVANLSVK